MGATDSKLAFRKSVFRLFEEEVGPIVMLNLINMTFFFFFLQNIPVDADDYWSLVKKKKWLK